MQELKLSIANLYPNELNSSADLGNLVVLKKRCSWRKIQVEINNININDEPTFHDLYFICGGSLKQHENVFADLIKNTDFYKNERDKGKVFLGINGGYQLLGNSYQNDKGETFNTLGILDIDTIAGKKRFCGNVTAKNNLIKEDFLVGFENHNDLTYLSKETKPLAIVNIGSGNNGKDKTEGAYFKNVFGTYLHGPFLAQNPKFADYLIQIALINKYNKKIPLPSLNDYFEMTNHKYLINKKY